MQLAGKDVPRDDRSAIVFDAAIAAFGLAREPLDGLADLRQNGKTIGDVAVLFRGVLEAVARAVEIADELKESPR